MANDKAFAIFWLKQIRESIHGGDEEFDSCRKRAIDIAVEELERYWIPVSERLPKTGKAVLVCCDDKLHKSMVVAYIDAFGLWHPITGDHIAYWMPLPEPPKEN